MSAQQLSDACDGLGHPIARSVLANFESGRRPTVSIAELLVFARALEVPAIELVFPLGREETIGVLPGASADTWDALKWFTGENDRLPGDMEETQDAESVQMYRDHDRLLDDWRNSRAKALRLMSRHPELDQFRTEEDPDAVDKLFLRQAQDAMERAQTEIFLVRRQMRLRGLLPPMLDWDEGAYIESPHLEGEARLVSETEGISPEEARRKIWSRVRGKTPNVQPQADDIDGGQQE